MHTCHLVLFALSCRNWGLGNWHKCCSSDYCYCCKKYSPLSITQGCLLSTPMNLWLANWLDCKQHKNLRPLVCLSLSDLLYVSKPQPGVYTEMQGTTKKNNPGCEKQCLSRTDWRANIFNAAFGTCTSGSSTCTNCVSIFAICLFRWAWWENAVGNLLLYSLFWYFKDTYYNIMQCPF